ncbi:hypothetical protein BTA07_13230 [Enterococcus faecium]|nr:hypothetical protein BTA07_13230 [Enterococcus faecium]
MRRTERAAYRTKFYSNLSSPTRFDEEPKGFYNILCWWKIEGDFLLTLFLRFNSKRDSLLVKFSRPKRHPTKGVSQWIIILENYSD